MTRDTFGRTSPRQFAEYDPDSSSWKTWPAIGLWGSTPYSGTWPRSGMTRDGRAYELPTSAHRTGVSESLSSLPTPMANDWRGANMQRRDDPRRQTPLADAVTLLPTPRTSDTNGAGKHGDGGPDLRTVAALLPTPQAQDARHSAENGANRLRSGRQMQLAHRVALLPTPRATDGTKGGPNQRGSSGDLMLPSAVVQLLPTPTAADSGNTPEQHLRKKPGRAQVTSLQVIVDHGLLPTGGRMPLQSDDGNESSDE